MNFIYTLKLGVGELGLEISIGWLELISNQWPDEYEANSLQAELRPLGQCNMHNLMLPKEHLIQNIILCNFM